MAFMRGYMATISFCTYVVLCIKGKRTPLPGSLLELATGMVAMYSDIRAARFIRVYLLTPAIFHGITRNTEQSRPEFDGDELHHNPI
jgi:hypothetical protein